MKRYLITSIIAIIFLAHAKGQEINTADFYPKISIQKLKPVYHKGDIIELKIKNSDTCVYKLLLEAEILINNEWYYDDSLTYLINNSQDDKLIPYYDIYSNQQLVKKFIVKRLFKSVANKIRFRISIFRNPDSFQEPSFIYSTPFNNCSIKYWE